MSVSSHRAVKLQPADRSIMEIKKIFPDRPRQKSFTIWIMVGSSIAINILNALDLFGAIFHSATETNLKIE